MYPHTLNPPNLLTPATRLPFLSTASVTLWELSFQTSNTYWVMGRFAEPGVKKRYRPTHGPYHVFAPVDYTTTTAPPWLWSV